MTTAVELDPKLVQAAERRAREEGLSVSAFITELIRRAIEREPGEEGILTYDHVGGTEPLVFDVLPGQDGEAAKASQDLYRELFRRR